MFLTKDFIETAEQLIFAVVANGLEHGKVLCFLRYGLKNGQLGKYSTIEANQLLQHHYPDYLHYSPVLDARLHAVPVERVLKHHQPKQRLQTLLTSEQPDAIEQDFMALCQLLQTRGVDLKQCGVTGSLLIGTQQAGSDLDLVCYDRVMFQHCRAVIAGLIKADMLQILNPSDWQSAYQRRECELDFADYVWHEQRKLNKAMINGRKFDLSLINPTKPVESCQKCGTMTIQAIVIDDIAAFDYPAEFVITHPEIHSVVSFTATYTGQAVNGELIEATGQIEQNAQGIKRLVIGSSREARGEYIKIIHAKTQ